MMASFELAWRRVFLLTLVLLSRDGVPQVCDLGIQLLDTFPSAWRRWHSVPKATLERGRSVEFPSEGNVSGYVCNHSSLRMGTRDCFSWPCFGHSCRSPLKKLGWCVPQVPFYARRRSLACVIGVHLPMSSALGVCNQASGNRSRWRRDRLPNPNPKRPSKEDAVSRSHSQGTMVTYLTWDDSTDIHRNNTVGMQYNTNIRKKKTN